MKLKINGLLTLLLVLVAQITFAQDISVAGIVTDQGGMPLPGVNVVVKGSSKGTQTAIKNGDVIGSSNSSVIEVLYVVWV